MLVPVQDVVFEVLGPPASASRHAHAAHFLGRVMTLDADAEVMLGSETFVLARSADVRAALDFAWEQNRPLALEALASVLHAWARRGDDEGAVSAWLDRGLRSGQTLG